MRTSSKIALGAAAVAAFLLARKKGAISGVGAVDNEWGAQEMCNYVLNIESLYDKYRNLVYRYLNRGEYYKDTINVIAKYLRRDIAYGYIPMQSGMGRGEKARLIAANDIYDVFQENWTYDNAHKDDMTKFQR